jgi:hypothetical protein
LENKASREEEKEKERRRRRGEKKISECTTHKRIHFPQTYESQSMDFYQSI